MKAFLFIWLLFLKASGQPVQPAKLGVDTVLTSTNRATDTLEPMGCPYCNRIHHYRVIEGYMIVRSNVVPASVGGKLTYIPIAEPLTNLLGIYTTNYVEHPAVHKPAASLPLPMGYPPLPPDPAVIYRQARAQMHRSGMNPTVVPPSTNYPTIQKLEPNTIYQLP